MTVGEVLASMARMRGVVDGAASMLALQTNICSKASPNRSIERVLATNVCNKLYENNMLYDACCF